MTECQNPTLQDVLPEFVAGTLPPTDAARVAAHVAECGACRDEVALLRTVRTGRPTAPSLDIAAIVAALPKPGTVTTDADAAAPALTVVRGGLAATPIDRTTSASASGTARRAVPRVSLTQWAAAAAVVVAVLGTAYTVASRSGGSTESTQIAVGSDDRAPAPTDVPLGADEARNAVAAGDSSPLVAPTPISEPVRIAAATIAPAVAPVDELADLSEDELEAFLDGLEAWDGATAVEPVRRVTSSIPTGTTSGGTR